MYELKTLLPQFDIAVPKCMYTMKNLNNANVADVQSTNAKIVTNVSGCHRFYAIS